jgi:hypothetical protein
MGCGCGRKGIVARRNIRPTVGPRPLVGGSAAGPSPAQVRAIGMQNATSLGESRRLDEQRLRAEKLRRDAIRKKLNK